jgi:hypothetical protein
VALTVLAAVLLRNSSGLTLEGGPMTVLEGDNYGAWRGMTSAERCADRATVGEAMLETIKADEERFVPYSIELVRVLDPVAVLMG